jgi:hypothetical protein
LKNSSSLTKPTNLFKNLSFSTFPSTCYFYYTFIMLYEHLHDWFNYWNSTNIFIISIISKIFRSCNYFRCKISTSTFRYLWKLHNMVFISKNIGTYLISFNFSAFLVKIPFFQCLSGKFNWLFNNLLYSSLSNYPLFILFFFYE